MDPDASRLELLFLWHHHQPDYRSPESGRAELPWVWLHASKDYLDMADHLAGYPAVRATFNFVPSLLDQLRDLEAGRGDTLHDLLRRPPRALGAADRALLLRRLRSVPPHARRRWPRLAALVDAAEREFRGGPALAERDLLDLECYFLLAWLDPLYHAEPEAVAALQAGEGLQAGHRDALLACHRRLLARVIPAYRALAERGQIELSASPYYHPILPLLIDVTAGRRALPQSALPLERLAAPQDARRQVEAALARHAEAFGAPPAGMWPSEGSVSPEVAVLAGECALRWLATGEGVLHRSLGGVGRDAAHRPYRAGAAGREVTLFFRDHELSDLIGFVYQSWEPEAAAADFLHRLRGIADHHRGSRPPVVSVILDGENCWEGYAEDGRPFLEALYRALSEAGWVRTRTFAEVAAEWPDAPLIERLHSGSWIDADFHIWVGHAEKNRAWDLIARTRRELWAAGRTPESHPAAWEALYAAEGSDWFWWFGDDHQTPDKDVFDGLFRAHLRGALARAGLAVPADLMLPVRKPGVRSVSRNSPIGFLRPQIDGRNSHYYEWALAGHYRLMDAGGAMHRGGGTVKELYFGFDAERFYLRLDFAGEEGERAPLDLALELMAPRWTRVVVHGLGDGTRAVGLVEARGGPERPLAEADCQVGAIFELGVPFTALGLAAGEAVEMVALALEGGQPVESFPSHEQLRFTVPSPDFEDTMWSA